MTRNETEDSVDLWRQVASAAEYIAAVERPGFSVWDALADALFAWSEASRTSVEDGSLDRLRIGFVWLLRGVPPPGAPDGASVAEVVGSALANWLEDAAAQVNDGRPFGTTTRQWLHVSPHGII